MHEKRSDSLSALTLKKKIMYTERNACMQGERSDSLSALAVILSSSLNAQGFGRVVRDRRLEFGNHENCWGRSRQIQPKGASHRHYRARYHRRR